MENKDPIDLGLEFIQTCCEAQNQFDNWVEHFNERELKTYFKRLVEIRSHLNDITRESRALVQELSERK